MCDILTGNSQDIPAFVLSLSGNKSTHALVLFPHLTGADCFPTQVHQITWFQLDWITCIHNCSFCMDTHRLHSFYIIVWRIQKQQKKMYIKFSRSPCSAQHNIRHDLRQLGGFVLLTTVRLFAFVVQSITRWMLHYRKASAAEDGKSDLYREIMMCASWYVGMRWRGKSREAQQNVSINLYLSAAVWGLHS